MNSNTPNLTLNPRTLQIGGPLGFVDINLNEFFLLNAFLAADNRRLSTEEMLALAGKANTAKSTLEVQLVRLRKKLIQAGAINPTIKVIRQYGYQLCTPLTLPNESCSASANQIPPILQSNQRVAL